MSVIFMNNTVLKTNFEITRKGSRNWCPPEGRVHYRTTRQRGTQAFEMWHMEIPKSPEERAYAIVEKGIPHGIEKVPFFQLIGNKVIVFHFGKHPVTVEETIRVLSKAFEMKVEFRQIPLENEGHAGNRVDRIFDGVWRTNTHLEILVHTNERHTVLD